jgi:phage-related protein
VPDEKEVVWVGTSLDDLREFPKDARQDTGFQLEQLQLGRDPDHWKPMPTVGAGCREIRISTLDGIFRVFYLTQFGDEIYVLHCFTNKTQKTSKKDIDTGERRYKEAQRMREKRKGRTP